MIFSKEFLLILLIRWQPTTVLLPGKFLGQRSLVSYSPWCHKSRTRLSDFTSFYQVKKVPFSFVRIFLINGCEILSIFYIYWNDHFKKKNNVMDYIIWYQNQFCIPQIHFCNDMLLLIHFRFNLLILKMIYIS